MTATSAKWHRLANEHRTAFGVEGAIGGEQHSVRAKKSSPQRIAERAPPTAVSL
jgi:hypothetical protein